MKRFLFFSFMLTAAFGCQLDQPISKMDRPTPFITNRTDAEVGLASGVTAILILLYEPLESLTPTQIEEIFSSSTNLNNFLIAEQIDRSSVYGNLTLIENSIQQILISNPPMDASDIVNLSVLDYIKEYVYDEDEPIGLGYPCTDAYINDVENIGYAMIGCIGMTGNAMECVGGAVMAVILAANDFFNCLESTYP